MNHKFENENENVQLARQIAEAVNNIFGDNLDFSVEIETEDGKHINFGTHLKDEPCNCTERLKCKEELTLGEKFVLYLLNHKHLNADNLTFENVSKFITDDVLLNFYMECTNPEDLDRLYNHISDLVESVMAVDLSKVRTIHQ